MVKMFFLTSEINDKIFQLKTKLKDNSLKHNIHVKFIGLLFFLNILRFLRWKPDRYYTPERYYTTQPHVIDV